MINFPDDVLREIFLRLSARHLVRFRCVCKSWNSLLTSPFFIKAYQERSIKLRKFDLLKYDFNNLLRVQIYYSPEKELSNLDISFVEDGENFKIVGSCNGIVCLSTSNSKNGDRPKILLWNPSTGENIALPPPNFNVSSLFEFGFDRLYVGFGFDPLSGHLDDFKVVNITVNSGHYGNATSSVEVYSFRRNCWKQLGNIFPLTGTRCLSDQVIFKNFICWWPSFPFGVVSLILFDVIEDVFRELALPDIMPREEKQITLLNGCLSILARNPSTLGYEVWIMKEFGVCESWTKLYTIGVSTLPWRHHWPLGFADSGDVFFLKGFSMGLRFKRTLHLVLYNVQREQFEAFEVKIGSSRSAQLVTCMESLISLSSLNNAEH